MTKIKAQIVATISPMSESPEILRSMFERSMGVVRLNFSFGKASERIRQINKIREFEKELGYKIPIIVDLPGPRMDTDGGHAHNGTSILAITPQDIEFIKFAVEHKADYVAVSYVGSPEDVKQCRDIINSLSGQQRIIAKIERASALPVLSEIIALSDAVMVARGDLGNEVPIEQIPFIQEDIVKKSKAAGKPVIVATEMMLSMVKNPVPTRAEVTDVANAICQGADAVMLSEETAVGKHPVEVVAIMERIIMESVRHMTPEAVFNNLKAI